MSSKDPLRPQQADPGATGEEAAKVVADAMRHAAERDEAARRRETPRAPSRWTLLLGLLLAAYAGYLVVAPPGWVVLDPVEAPSPVAEEQSLRFAMYLQAEQIEAYRAEHGVLPPSLDALPGSPARDRFEYARDGDGFRLVAAFGDESIVYDSLSPDPAFAASVRARMAGAEG